MAAISISVENIIFEQSWLAIGEESIYGNCCVERLQGLDFSCTGDFDDRLLSRRDALFLTVTNMVDSI